MRFKSRQARTFAHAARQWLWPASGFARAWKYLVRRMARMRVSPHSLALGFAAGAAVSFTPFIGFHFVLAALVALVTRGNVIASAFGTVIGNPLTFPFIWLGSYNLGAWLLGSETKSSVSLEGADPGTGFWTVTALWDTISPLLLPMLLGGIPMGILCGAICYWMVRKAVEQIQAARQRRRALVA